MKAYRDTLICLLGSVTLYGCSVPVTRHSEYLTFGFRRTDVHTQSTETVVPGIDVRLGSVADGINIGWNSLMIAEPKNPTHLENEALELGQGYVAPIGWRTIRGGIVQEYGWFWWRRPQPSRTNGAFIASSQLGIAFNTSPADYGIGLGFSSRTCAILPPKRSNAYFLIYSSRHPEDFQFVLLPEARIPNAPKP